MNKSKAKNFFNDAEKERITAAIVAAEAETSGEIATMVVSSSDSYREADFSGGVLLSGLVALVLAVALNQTSVWTYVPLVIIFFLPCRMMLRSVPRLKLSIVGRKRIEEAVRERAIRAFYEKGLHKTREETGILIFISLLEHKVWILGDKGIDAKIDPHSWGQLAGELANGIKEGRGCDSLCKVISECGELLSQHFPRRDDDTNELPDRILH